MTDTNVTLLHALSLMYSYIYNPRRTEDLTHPLWSKLVSDLCRAHSENLLPTPQFKLYVSPLDANFQAGNGDTSIETVFDPDAKGVITDFCILMPNIVLVGLSEVQAANVLPMSFPKMQVEIPFQNFSVEALFVPLLVELKRPLSRHFPDIKKYVKTMERILEHARNQVEAQAACLFCSPKYASQKYVLLIAIVGEWWSLSVKKRHQAYQFDMYHYLNIVQGLDDLEKRDDDTFLRKLDWNGDPMLPNDNVQSFVQTRRAEARDIEEQRRNWKEKERERRALKRATWAERSTAREELKNFLNDPNVDTVNKFYRLVANCEDPDSLRVDGYSRGVGALPSPNLTKEELLRDRWTTPMRIGSQASNAYLAFIANELATAVSNKSY